MECQESEFYLDRLLGKDLVNLLKCSICLDYFSEPSILPCGHTFCYSCLKNIGEYQIKSAGPLIKEENIMGLIIACPTCRSRIYYGQIIQKEKGVVKSNYALSSIIDALKNLRERKQCDQSTNTETNAYISDRLDSIQKNIDSVFEAVNMKGSVITEANKDIENIRKLTDESTMAEEHSAVSKRTFQFSREGKEELEVDMHPQENTHFPFPLHSDVHLPTMFGQTYVNQSSSPLPATPSTQKPVCDSSEIDPGYVDPAILSYGSSINLQYGGSLDSNMLHILTSNYGQ